MPNLRPLLFLLLLHELSCTTVQFASFPTSERTGETLNHCLASLGFRDDPELYAYFRDSDPELRAVWSMPSRAVTAAPGTTVWVEEIDRQWRLRFLPGVREDDSGTALLARGFAACLPMHLPDTPVTIESRTSPDLR